MILGCLAEVKTRWITEWWFSTSQNGGFRPGHSELPGSGFNRCRSCRPRLWLRSSAFLFSDPRSSVFIRGKLSAFSSLQISVISVYQW